MSIKSRNYRDVLSAPEAEVVKTFVDELLIPNSAKIHFMYSRGDITVAAFDPLPSVYGIFPALGGVKGGGPIFAMSASGRKSLSEYEPVTKKWFERKLPDGFAKIFAVIHSGTFLFNWSSSHTLEIELGSLDQEKSN